MHLPDLAAFFVPGSVYRWTDGTSFEVEVLDAGRLELTTGKVVATDPAWPALDDAVAAVVQPGSYPVSLSVARSRSAPERALVSAVRMLVSERPVESWAPAWQRVTSEGTARSLGFTVDAGQACLLDQAALPFLIELADDEEASIERSLRVNHEMFEHVVDEATGMNVIVFACGMGDGTYPVWSGSTTEGVVAQVVVDLEFLSRCIGAENRSSRP